MDATIINECKLYIENNNIESLQFYFYELINSQNTAQPDWPVIFHKVYLHSCLKGRLEISEWLEKTVYPMMDGIQQIALRQIFPYGRHLLSKAKK
jgi:hypothetical protein